MKPLRGASPALPDDLEPVEVEVGDEDLGQGLGLGHACGALQVRPGRGGRRPRPRRGWADRGGTQLGGPLEDAVQLEPAEEGVGALLDRQLVRLEGDLRLVRGGSYGSSMQVKCLSSPALHPRVLALGIALLELVDGDVEEDLVEGDALVLVALPAPASRSAR